MRIAIVGKFKRLHDEEYIARSFEALGHEIYRIDQTGRPSNARTVLDTIRPEIVLFTKWENMPERGFFSAMGTTTVCWLFDLYWGYQREYRIHNAPYFRADRVFTTDGGHDEAFKAVGVPHQCVRQGIYRPECYIAEGIPDNTVLFVGSHNPANLEREKMLQFVFNNFELRWYGKDDTNELRGHALNLAFANNKIVVGDSVWSPFYWSNRVVETLGRGGFLIHVDVPGIKEEYPDLVTYPRGDYAELKRLISYYLEHEEERQQIVHKNFEWVKERYTMDKKCAELLSKI